MLFLVLIFLCAQDILVLTILVKIILLIWCLWSYSDNKQTNKEICDYFIFSGMGYPFTYIIIIIRGLYLTKMLYKKYTTIIPKT